MDVLTTIKGKPDGTGKGLTTYPSNPDPEQQAAHVECLKLEKDGKVYRYVDNDGQSHGHGAPFVIWYPAADAPAGASPKPAAPPA